MRKALRLLMCAAIIVPAVALHSTGAESQSTQRSGCYVCGSLTGGHPIHVLAATRAG